MATQHETVEGTRRDSGTWAVAWPTLALSFGTLLFVLRSLFLLLGFGRVPPASFELGAWHVALTMGRVLPWALATGALASAVALSIRAVPAAALGSVLFASVLSGWPFALPGDLPDPTTGSGLLSIGIQLLTAIVLAILLVRARSRPESARPRLLTLPSAITFATVLPLAVWFAFGREPPRRLVRETAREILLDPAAWTVVSSLPNAPPEPGVLTPSVEATLDGGDLSALVMPPPCEVRFTVGPEAGSKFLRASAGLDRKINWQLKDAPEDCAVDFEIAVNGERRFAARIPGRETGPRRIWHHAGGRRGIELAPGDTVTLRTSLSPPDARIFGVQPLQAGFGRLELERVVDRPYRRSSAKDPNVLMIVMDTLRADSLSCYGQREYATPALDALARRGILYERAHATSSWTWPSTASILTGLPPEAHGVLDEKACYLDGELDTLAEVLRDRDLATAAFICNPILDPSKNFDQGFETYDYSREFRMSDAVVGDVATWIDQHRDARFFLYLHLIDPHQPTLARAEDFASLGLSTRPPPGSPQEPLIEYARRLLEGDSVVPDGRTDPDPIVPADQQRWIHGAYAASVLSADHCVGEILRALEESGLDENTIVVFTSDHGEELFDHGLLGHGLTLYQELVHVPLMIAGPGVPRGARVATPVSNRSLFRTLAIRCDADARAVPEDVDLLSPASVAARPLFFTTEKGWWWNAPRSPLHGTLEWPWVLHVSPRGLAWGRPKGADPGEGQMRLYDLESDPAERIDRSVERAELAAAMRARLAEHTRSSTRIRSSVGAGAGDATIDLLRRIGYTGDGK